MIFTRAFNVIPNSKDFNVYLHRIRTASAMINISGAGGLEFSALCELWGPPKCFSGDELMLMYDGSTKAARDVRVGDRLMGPDSAPRTVLETHSGVDEMYRVTPRKRRESFVVNSAHLLHLDFHRHWRDDWVTRDVPAAKYETLPADQRHHARIVTTGVEFEHHFVPMNPRLLGMMLGDGSLISTPRLYGMDEELLAFAEEEFAGMPGIKPTRSSHSGCSEVFAGGTPGRRNHLTQIFADLGLEGVSAADKFVPRLYKVNCRRVRMEVLGGLIDTDGHYNRKLGFYEFSSSSEQLCRDVLWLARSLGIDAGIAQRDNHHRVHIYGHVACLLERKRSNPSDFTSKRGLGIRSVESIGRGEYYGWTVDGDHLHVDANFRVQHNSGKTTLAYQTAQLFLEDYGDNAMVLILDPENSASVLRLKRIFGLNIGNHPQVKNGDSRVFIERAATIEQGVEMISRYTDIATEKGKFLLVIWDSITTSRPRREYEYINGVLDKEITNNDTNSEGKDKRKEEFGTNMALNQLRPQIIKWGLNVIMDRIAMKPVFVFLINQATTKLTQYGAVESSGGGYGFKHNIHYSIKVKFGKKLGGEATGSLFHTGTLSYMEIEKSKVIPSLDNVNFFIRDDLGGRLDMGAELIAAGRSLGMITDKSGGWYRLKEGLGPVEERPPQLDKWYTMKNITAEPLVLQALGEEVTKHFRGVFQLLDYTYEELEAAIQEEADAIAKAAPKKVK